MSSTIITLENPYKFTLLSPVDEDRGRHTRSRAFPNGSSLSLSYPLMKDPVQDGFRFTDTLIKSIVERGLI